MRADGFVEYEGLWWKLALPQVILAVHLGVAAWAATYAGWRSHLGWRVVAPGLAAGWALWTLFEYVFHRWLLHDTRHRLRKRIFWHGLHKEHHGYRSMSDPDHHGIHVAISQPIVLAVVGLTAWASSGGFEVSAAAGWVVGYCAYEGLHWLFHSADEPRGPATVRRLWRAHAMHHLRRADLNFGFVTTFWDRRFGTFADLESTPRSA